MRIRACLFVLVAVLLVACPAGSIAIERDKSFGTSSGSWKNESSATASGAGDARAIARLIDDINAAVKKDKRRMLSIITINTDVAGTTLERESARTGLTFGDLYVAHALTLATQKKFDRIIVLKKGGQSWAQIARAHNVSLKGSTQMLKEMMKN